MKTGRNTGSTRRKRQVLLLFLSVTILHFFSPFHVLSPATYWDFSTDWSFYSGTGANSGPVTFNTAFTATGGNITDGIMRFQTFNMGTEWANIGFSSSQGTTMTVTEVLTNQVKYSITASGTSTTKVWAPSTPKGASGQDSWSYDAGTNVVTVTATNNANIVLRWDIIRLLTLGSSESTVFPYTTILLYATAELEDEDHALGSGDWFILDGVNFTWDASDARFEASLSYAVPTDLTIDTFDEGYEATYGITMGGMSGLSLTLIWSEATETGSSGGGSSWIPPPIDTGIEDLGDAITPSIPWIREHGPKIIIGCILGVALLSQVKELPIRKKRKKAVKKGLKTDKKRRKKIRKKVGKTLRGV